MLCRNDALCFDPTTTTTKEPTNIIVPSPPATTTTTTIHILLPTFFPLPTSNTLIPKGPNGPTFGAPSMKPCGLIRINLSTAFSCGCGNGFVTVVKGMRVTKRVWKKRCFLGENVVFTTKGMGFVVWGCYFCWLQENVWDANWGSVFSSQLVQLFDQ